MDEEEDVDAMAETESARAEGCKRRARLHRSFSFLHLSRALKKLHAHARRGRQANATASEPPTTPSSSSAAASFLSGCMHHPRTHSFASGRRDRGRHSHDNSGDAALAVNFRSLRVGPVVAAAAAGDGDGSSSSPRYCYGSDGEREGGEVAPLAAAALASKAEAVVGGAGVAVVTFSAAPYDDFRQSMREMVDAATGHSGGTGDPAAPAVDWDFMEELLFCYLHLNDRAVHRDILRAFTDTVAALRRRRRAATSRRTSRQRLLGAGADSGDDGDEE